VCDNKNPEGVRGWKGREESQRCFDVIVPASKSKKTVDAEKRARDEDERKNRIHGNPETPETPRKL